VKILVVCCLHGDEKFGLRIAKLLTKTPIGGIDFIIGNPKAVAANKRYVDSDLNRSFRQGEGYEAKRALEISALFAKYNYVIDIHTTSTDLEMVPIFVSFGPKSKKILNVLDSKQVVIMPKSKDSLIGAFGNGAVSLEFGDSYCRSNSALHEVHEFLLKLASRKERRPKTREIYRITSLAPPKTKKTACANFQYSKLLGGYGFLIGERSYKDFGGFVAQKKQKLVV